ncbi:hypothetical protein GCM10012284_61410 [Mangrovihabitans endophyticus]|uniref:Ricin B lectin domain-containing protein n=1 Tax=Mangrovihabitans endophyticus TaxID=1751298 RepID=A0A8J3C8K7_9ACTN|nr:hypothetical protein GCM10012284_61410 [Mangrovihabitans endophyticus]
MLVRPYITTEAGSAGTARTRTRWPEPAPAGDTPVEADTRVMPALFGADGPGTARLRRIVLLGGALVLMVAAAVVMLATGGREDDDAPAASLPGGGVLPAITGPSGHVPSAGGSAGPSPSASGSTRPSASASASSAGASAAAPTGSAASSSPTATPSSAAPSATLAPPPAADRTGAITSAGGRCLALGGLLGIDGSPIQAAGCGGGSAQWFTLASDGTLRVARRCAQVTGDQTVRSVGCDDRAGAQWRTGPGGTLVNPASGGCLTDPGAAGATVRVAACDGGTTQHWSVP